MYTLEKNKRYEINATSSKNHSVIGGRNGAGHAAQTSKVDGARVESLVFFVFFCAFLLIPNSPYTLACKQAPGGMVWPRLKEPRRELSGSSFFPLHLRPILNLRACSQAIVHGQAGNQVMH